jgi:hypothetical protein
MGINGFLVTFLLFDHHRLSTKTIENTLNSQKTQFLLKIELTRVEIFEFPCKKFKIKSKSKKVTRNPIMPIDSVHTCLNYAT